MSIRGAVLLVTLALAACSDLSPPRGPGTLQAVLRSPNGSEGAAVVFLLGDGVLGVTASGDTEVHASTSGETTRVVLINMLAGTLSFEVSVADVSRPLVPLIREVAGPDDELRSDLSEYSVVLSR